MKVSTVRKKNMDILRIIAMSMITVIHYFAYTEVSLDFISNRVQSSILTILFSLSRSAVNIFYLISGYFLWQSTFSKKRITNIYRKGLYVSVVLLLVGFLFLGDSISFFDILKCVFPFLSAHYWYLFVYIILLLSIPLLNQIINGTDEKTMEVSLIFGGIILCVIITLNPLIVGEVYIGGDHNILWAFYCYLLGAYFGKYGIPKRKKLYWGLVSIAILIMFFVKIFKLENILGEGINIDGTSNSSIIPLIMSLSLFLAIGSICVNSVSGKFLSFNANASLYVYLFQEHNLLRGLLWGDLNQQLEIYGIDNLTRLLIIGAIIWIAAILLYVGNMLVELLMRKIFIFLRKRRQ